MGDYTKEMAVLIVCASCLIGCSVLVYESTGAGTFVPSLRLSVEVCCASTCSPVETR